MESRSEDPLGSREPHPGLAAPEQSHRLRPYLTSPLLRASSAIILRAVKASSLTRLQEDRTYQGMAVITAQETPRGHLPQAPPTHLRFPMILGRRCSVPTSAAKPTSTSWAGEESHQYLFSAQYSPPCNLNASEIFYLLRRSHSTPLQTPLLQYSIPSHPHAFIHGGSFSPE